MENLVAHSCPCLEQGVGEGGGGGGDGGEEAKGFAGQVGGASQGED